MTGPKPWPERADRVMYTSSPDRGGDILLEEWGRIREAVPTAEFAMCYPAVYDAVADQDATVAEHRKRVRELSDQPGVVRLGALSQPALAEMLCDSKVWAHPSWVTMLNSPFHETSCIAAMEAQAAGCCVVASDWGALRETVQWGSLVNSDPPGKRWRDALVKHIIEGLTNAEKGERAVYQGPRLMAEMGWEGVGLQVGQLIAEGVRGARSKTLGESAREQAAPLGTPFETVHAPDGVRLRLPVFSRRENGSPDHGVYATAILNPDARAPWMLDAQAEASRDTIHR